MERSRKDSEDETNSRGMVSLDIDAKKFAVIERYVLVFILIVMLYCLGVLFSAYSQLQTEYRGTIINTLNKNSEALRDLKESNDALKAGLERLGERSKK